MENSCKTRNKPSNIKELLKSGYFWKPLLGITIGVLAGFLYFYFVGCSSGSCAITASPYGSMLMGGGMGYLISSGPCCR